MSKKTFSNLRLRELDGGLNLKDYVTEIENKQAIVCKNWNFDGNKLVNSKGIDKQYNGDAICQGLTVDGEDIWYVEKGNIYKNGNIEYYTNKYTITFSSIDGNIFSISIDGVENIYQFSYTGNEELALSDFETQFKLDYPSYNISRNGSVFTIYKDDGTSISITNPNIVKDITVNDWNEFVKLDIIIDGVTYSGDGTTYTTAEDFLNYIDTQLDSSYKRKINNNILTIGKVGISISSNTYDRYTYELAYGRFDYSSDVTFDYTKLDIDSDSYEFSTTATSYNFPGDIGIRNFGGYTATGSHGLSSTSYPSVSAYGLEITANADIIINSVTKDSTSTATRAVIRDDTGTILTTATFSGDIATFTTEIRVRKGDIIYIEADADGASYNVEYYDKSYLPINTEFFTITNGTYDTRMFGNIENINITTASVSYDYIIDNIIFNTTYGENSNWSDYSSAQYFQYWHYLYFHKTGFPQLNISSLDYFTDGNTDDKWTTITEINNLATITITDNIDVTIIEDNIGTLLDPFERYNITVNEYGLLLTGTNFNPVIIVDGTPNELPISIVGEPTVGTIYNGKTVLGGYGNDSIIFSKTSTPSNPEYIKEFSLYDSGGQLVSGGNKGNIVGFITGENGLYVFKDNEVYYTNSEKDSGADETTPSFNFIFKKIASYGANNQNCITEVGQEIFYYDHKTRAVRRLGYEQNLTTLRDRKISKEIDSYLNAIPDDDEGNNERYSQLINASFKYPLYKLHITSSTSPYVQYHPTNLDTRYRVPNITLVYNVENKSWSTETNKDYDGKRPVVSFKGIFGTDTGDIYEDDIGNTNEDGEFKGKLFTLGDDIDVKKWGELEMSGRIEPTTSKTVTITPIVHYDETTTDGTELTDYTETITATENTDFRSRINMYEFARGLQHKITHTGDGYCEIASINTKYKPTTI